MADLGDLIERDSGLLVPSRLAPAAEAGVTTVNGTAYDPDGRRRVVLDNRFRRRLNDVITTLNAQGFGIVVGCSNLFPRKDGRPSCGQIMLPVGKDTLDPGFQCHCTRIHWGR